MPRESENLRGKEDALRNAEIERLNKELNAKNILCEDLKKQLDLSKSGLNETAASLRSAENSRQQFKEKLDAALDELQRTKDDLGHMQTQFEELSMKFTKEHEVNVSAETEIAGLKSQLQEREKVQAATVAELKDKEDTAVSLTKRIQTESEHSRRELERAITSSVRLCVVAPTVNVHLGDRKLRFNKSGVTEQTLRAFIHDEVLSQYSCLFKQREENKSPDGETSIQVWVQKMLDKMQHAIEQHVNAAIDNSAS